MDASQVLRQQVNFYLSRAALAFCWNSFACWFCFPCHGSTSAWQLTQLFCLFCFVFFLACRSLCHCSPPTSHTLCCCSIRAVHCFALHYQSSWQYNSQSTTLTISIFLLCRCVFFAIFYSTLFHRQFTLLSLFDSLHFFCVVLFQTVLWFTLLSVCQTVCQSLCALSGANCSFSPARAKLLILLTLFFLSFMTCNMNQLILLLVLCQLQLLQKMNAR